MDCCICGRPIETDAYGWGGGNNAYPIKDGRCCNHCNDKRVMPERILLMVVNGDMGLIEEVTNKKKGR